MSTSKAPGASGADPSCVHCNDLISNTQTYYIPPCDHPLHQSCLLKIPKKKPNCPACNGKLALHLIHDRK